MKRLVALEVRRALSRRLVRVLVLLAVIAIVVAGIVVFFHSRPAFDSRAALDAATARRAALLQECLDAGPKQGVIFGPDRAALTPEEFCDRFGVPRVEDLTGGADKRFRLTDLGTNDENPQGALYAAASFLVIAALIAGASMAGAEWRHGTMTTLLTWEPRRIRVLLAKVVAYAAVAMVIAFALEVLLATALLPAVHWRGTTAGADAAWFRHLAGAVGRISALTGISAAAGFCIASIGRNTSAAMGAAFAYLAVIEAIVRAVRPHWQRWLIGENGAVFLTGESLRAASFQRGTVAALATLLGYVAILWLVALALFVRRDVT